MLVYLVIDLEIAESVDVRRVWYSARHRIVVTQSNMAAGLMGAQLATRKAASLSVHVQLVRKFKTAVARKERCSVVNATLVLAEKRARCRALKLNVQSLQSRQDVMCLIKGHAYLCFLVLNSRCKQYLLWWCCEINRYVCGK